MLLSLLYSLRQGFLALLKQTEVGFEHSIIEHYARVGLQMNIILDDLEDSQYDLILRLVIVGYR